MKRIVNIFIVVLLLLGTFPTPSFAQIECSESVVVMNTSDSGAGSLRQAIIDVCTAGTISFDSNLSGTTIVLTSELILNKDVNIDGSALAEKINISGNNLVRVFSIVYGYTVSLDSLIITNGNLSGPYGNGGGINNGGTLTILNSNLANNYSAIGGGIHNYGTLTITNSTLSQNNAINGGALTNTGVATLTECTLSENEAGAGAGIDATAGTLTVTGSTFSGNSASSRGGGLIVSSGAQVVVFKSTFVNNTAGELGGGGIINMGTTSVINSTFTGNVLTDSWAKGSAINNFWGNLILYNSTLSGNTGFVTLNNENASMSFANTIIASTISGWDCSTAYGTLTGSINNWVSDGASGGEACGATSFGDPMLNSLADNGGPTHTIALLEGSGAIDAGDDTICGGTLVGCVDQRGVSRPQGAQCDIGAFELEQAVATGGLKISKVFDPLTSGFVDSFTLLYDCGGEYWAYITLGAGESQTFNGIPVGSQCFVSESTLPTPPTGWSFGTPTFSPSDPVTIGETLTEVVVTNTIIEDVPVTGSLKITKVFDPLTSGFEGTFVVKYDCDGDIYGFIDLGAGEATTIDDLPTGSQCTVSEVGIPTPPAGWSFETPIFSPSNMVTIGETLAEVTITNTIIADAPATGELVIAKTFDPLTSGFTDTFAIEYDCDDGTAHDGTVNLAAGTSDTITGIPLGTICTITEPSLPTPPTGWSFELPTFAPETGAVTITEASPAYAEVVVTNTISRDTGSLMITKYFDPLTSGYADTFAINYDCDDGETHDGTVNLLAGDSETISDIPTGTICTITEPTLPTPPTGWSFGEPVLSPADGIVTVVIGTQGSSTIMAPAEAWVTVTNTISRDLGELKISKVFDPLTSGFIGDFTITYDCDDDPAHDGTVYLAAGEYETITGIPTGTTCIVSEGELPAAPAGWSFNGPTYLPINGTAIISLVTSEVVVTNTIVEDIPETGELKITKVFDPLTSGFSGEFTIAYDCDGTEHDGTVYLAAGASQFITGIPIGTTCTVGESTLPTAPEGWLFKAPILSPASGAVTISEASPAFAEVIVTNAIVDVRSQVTTTRTKCSAFAANLAPDLDRLVITTAYNRKTGDTYIKKVTPSAFYYYAKTLIPAEASVITVSNMTDPFGYPNLPPTTNLYNENCVPLAQSMATITTGPGLTVRIEFPAAASERIIYIAVSYATKPLVGYVIDLPFSGFTYTFKTALDGAIFTLDDLFVNYSNINLSKFELP